MDDFEDDGTLDGWCLECGDDFRLDDTGGYNPPCHCGACCRSCCDHRRCYDQGAAYKDEPEDDDPEALDA